MIQAFGMGRDTMTIVLQVLMIFVLYVSAIVRSVPSLLFALAAGIIMLLCFRHKLRWRAGGIVVALAAAILAPRIYAYLGYTTDRDGLTTLNSMSLAKFSAREVCVVRGGFMIDKSYRFKFKASAEEVERFARQSGLAEIGYDGGSVDWPPSGVMTYWWKPPRSSQARVFRTDPYPKVLLYDPKSQYVFYHWWDT